MKSLIITLTAVFFLVPISFAQEGGFFAPQEHGTEAQQEWRVCMDDCIEIYNGLSYAEAEFICENSCGPKPSSFEFNTFGRLVPQQGGGTPKSTDENGRIIRSPVFTPQKN